MIPPLQRFRALAGLPLLFAVGCGAGTVLPFSSNETAHISGKAFGGQAPIAGAKIYLYAAGSSSTYGAGATSLLSAGGQDYVTSDQQGAFNITGDYTCNAGTQLYVVAIGGSAGGPDNPNTAISEMDALGDCSQVSASTFIMINEVSTVAGVVALQQFMTVDSSGRPNIGTSSGNIGGLDNAFLNAITIVPPGLGAVSSNTSGVTYPQAEIDTLADILAGCVNSTGEQSLGCELLFDNIANPNRPDLGTLTNTLQAMLAIAQNPGAQPQELYYSMPAQPPFQPVLPTAPNDWTVGTTYTSPELVKPLDLAVDGSGNAFVYSCGVSCSGSASDRIVGFSATGSVITPAGGFSGAAAHNVFGLAIDTAGNLWTVNEGATKSGVGNTQDSLGHFPIEANGTSTYVFTSPNLSTPYDLVLDKFGNFYVSNETSAVIDYVLSAQQAVYPAENPYFIGQVRGLALEAVSDPNGTGKLFVSDAAKDDIAVFAGERYSDSAPGGLTFLNGYNQGDVSGPNGIAIGSDNQVWYVNSAGATVAALDDTGQRIGNAIGSESFGNINTVAVDGNGNAWVPSCNLTCGSIYSGNVHPDSLAEITIANQSLSFLSPRFGFENPAFSDPAALAIDASGNVWVTNSHTPSVTVLIGVAGPVQTPVQAALINGTIGKKP